MKHQIIQINASYHHFSKDQIQRPNNTNNITKQIIFYLLRVKPPGCEIDFIPDLDIPAWLKWTKVSSLLYSDAFCFLKWFKIVFYACIRFKKSVNCLFGSPVKMFFFTFFTGEISIGAFLWLMNFTLEILVYSSDFSIPITFLDLQVKTNMNFYFKGLVPFWIASKFYKDSFFLLKTILAFYFL